jgi:N-acetyl-anhydromuramyl-L-alanine amidase AmpD
MSVGELREIAERLRVRSALITGGPDPIALTDIVFAMRHPGRTEPIGDADDELIAEWKAIREHLVEPELVSGRLDPAGIGSPPTPVDQRGLRPGAVISPLAHCIRGVRDADGKANDPRCVVVHCTGSSLANKSIESAYERSAVDFGLDVYLSRAANAVYPHYLIDFRGAIYATCSEDQRARHAGWSKSGGKEFWTSGAWSAPAWWKSAWPDAETPLDLLPLGVESPNTNSIGVELLIHHQRYTADQYRALGRLLVDLERRYPAIRLDRAPQARLLVGHEDIYPVSGEGGRANAGGGWDPGAHRVNPFFDWSRVWTEVARHR